MAFGTPFRFADSNSGRYLPILFRIMDPDLFPVDPVVDSFERFRSIFYTGLGAAFKTLGLSIRDVESLFTGIHIALKLVLLGVLFFFVRPLNLGPAAFFLFAAWAIHEKSAGVGSDSMFAPSLTHATVAALIGIAALGFQLRRLPLLFWLLAAGMIFVHAVMAIHLALIVFLAAAVRDRGRLSRPEWLGAALFLLASLIYMLTMAPPGFSAEEAGLFLSAKGEMGHVSPQAQGIFGWTKALGQLLLGVLVCKSVFSDRKDFDRLYEWMLAGAILAPVLGFLAITTGQYQLAQLQPMRMFEWVNFIVFCILVCGVAALWKTDRMRSSLLLLVVLLNILDSLWLFPWLFFVIFVFGTLLVEHRQRRPGRQIRPAVWKWGAAALLILPIGFYILKDWHPFESFYDPFPILVILLSWLSAFWWSGMRPFRQEHLVVIAIAFALIGRSYYLHEYIEARQDQAYLQTSRWIAQNTPEDARFITAIPGTSGGNFRARALRTSINESQSALFWVDPLVAVENEAQAAQVLGLWNERSWDLESLLSLARSWGADYLLVSASEPLRVPAVFQQGQYHVLEVP